MKSPAFSRGTARRAAGLATTIIAVYAGIQVYWALGGTWGLSGAWGGTYTVLPATLRIASGISALTFAVAAIIVIGRAGYRIFTIPSVILRWGTWVFAAGLLFSAFMNFISSSNWERFLNGPLAILLVILFVIVARSTVPSR